MLYFIRAIHFPKYLPRTSSRAVMRPTDSFVTTRRYASAVYAVVVCPFCPSVYQSVTSRRSTKMAKPRITKTTPYDSQGL